MKCYISRNTSPNVNTIKYPMEKKIVNEGRQCVTNHGSSYHFSRASAETSVANRCVYGSSWNDNFPKIVRHNIIYSHCIHAVVADDWRNVIVISQPDNRNKVEVVMFYIFNDCIQKYTNPNLLGSSLGRWTDHNILLPPADIWHLGTSRLRYYFNSFEKYLAHDNDVFQWAYFGSRSIRNKSEINFCSPGHNAIIVSLYVLLYYA